MLIPGFYNSSLIVCLVQDEIAMLKQESEMPFEDLISQLPKDLIDNIDKPFNVDEVCILTKFYFFRL